VKNKIKTINVRYKEEYYSNNKIISVKNQMIRSIHIDESEL